MKTVLLLQVSLAIYEGYVPTIFEFESETSRAHPSLKCCKNRAQFPLLTPKTVGVREIYDSKKLFSHFLKIFCQLS